MFQNKFSYNYKTIKFKQFFKLRQLIKIKKNFLDVKDKEKVSVKIERVLC